MFRKYLIKERYIKGHGITALKCVDKKKILNVLIVRKFIAPV